MYMVFVTLEIDVERREEFLAGIRANARATLRDEPGCLRFDIHRSIENPARYHFYELYRDREAFEIAHKAAPHYADWRRVVERCVMPGTHVNVFAEPVSPSDIPESAAAL